MIRNKGTITKLFGIKQEEMAALLKISEGQWSMFESGKRDLPLETKKQVAEMLQHLQSASKVTSDIIQQQDKTKTNLENLVVINQHRQLIAAKKIEDIQKKQAKAKGTLQLMDFLKNQSKDKKTHIDDAIKLLELRVEKDMRINGEHALIAQQLKLKVLEYEEKLLKDTLKKINF